MPPVGRVLLFWPSVKERCFDSGGGEVIGSDDATEPLCDREMISNVIFREETGARERWDGFSATTGSFSGVGTFPGQFLGNTKQGLFFTWTEWPKFNMSRICRNVVPTFILVMGYNLWKVLTNWRKSVQTDACFSLKEFGGTNKKKLLFARLQETEIRFYWSFTSSSPHLFLRGVPTADRPPSPPIFLFPAAPSSTSVSWYSHHLSSSHLHLTSFTLSYMSLELRLVNCRESLNFIKLNHRRIL